MIITWDSPTGRKIHKEMVDGMVEELELERLTKMMEEMANTPKEEFGKRQPGERGKYEGNNTSS